MYIWEILSLLLASVISFATIYLHLSSQNKELLVAILLVLLLLFVTRVVFSNSSLVSKRSFKVFALFLSSAMAQLLVLSSGGFYSPFIVLIHFLTLGVSFLFDTSVAMSFLVLSIGLLVFQVKADAIIYEAFIKDFWVAVLYFITFLVIVPISFLIARSYRLKDSLSKALTEHIRMGKLREESILSGLNELVLVTDTNLGILYINPQTEKELDTSSTQILHHNIFNVLPLKDSQGNQATAQALSINEALTDKAARIVNDFYFYGKRRYRVSVQIKPIVDLNSKVMQLVFVITDAKYSASSISQNHTNLEQAHYKSSAMFDDLRKTLLLNQSQELVAKIELLHKIEEDLLIATELEDHPVKETPRLQDVALLCKQVVVTKRNFARALKVPIIFTLPDNEASESSLLSLVESNVTKSLIPISDFVVPADHKWLEVVIDKLLDISLLLSLGEPKAQIEVLLHRDKDNVYAQIQAQNPIINAENQNNLFVEQFGTLSSKTGLRFGSGLEGYIIKMIKEQLNIQLEVNIKQNPATVTFVITLTKKPR